MSEVPILNNKPIDQWKVTELKEELKKRKLTTGGLKAELIKRLDEAIRSENENAEEVEEEGEEEVEKEECDEEVAEKENAEKGVDNGLKRETEPDDAAAPIVQSESENTVGAADQNEKKDGAAVSIEINDSVKVTDDGKPEEDAPVGSMDLSVMQNELTANATTEQTSITDTETSVAELTTEEDMNKLGTQGGTGNSRTQLESEYSKIPLDNKNPKPALEDEDSKPKSEDVLLDSSASDKQVSEVNPTLGSQVISSNSTDSVSINEKIELKEKIFADNVKLEIDVVKAEIVEPSSSNVVPDGSDSHPMDVVEPQEKASAEVKDEKYTTDADMWTKNDSIDVGYSEKLNLDRSSGDDSIEEDVMDIKQIDSKDNIDEVKNTNVEVDNSMEDTIVVDVVGIDVPTDRRESRLEKRKLDEPEIVGTTEPLKRQRRWNAESVKVPEPQSSNIAPTTTPKNASHLSFSRRNISLSDSMVIDDVPKERVVPPSQKHPTNSLRVDRFLRPFTLKAVQELLGKTGSVTSFWMDQIKTHCYVMYSSIEEAVETRNAVYNLQWPPNGGRLLVAEFVNPQEVKMRVDGPPILAVPIPPAAAPSATPTVQAQPSPRQQLPRQQLPPPPPLPQSPHLSNLQMEKERFLPPPPPPLQEKQEPPIVTLDDLFRKTKATPRIYYLPLTDDQVEAKLAERAKNSKQ